MGLQGEVGDNNAARSVLPDAAVTTALVGSSLSILRARHTSNLVLLPRWKVRGIPIPHCEGLYEAIPIQKLKGVLGRVIV